MDHTAIPRSIARVQYAAVRLPLTVVDERVVARQWGESAPVRLWFELSLGYLDRLAGWLLADERISWRGQALIRRTGHPAKAGIPRTKVPVRSAPDEHILLALPADARPAGGQDQEMGGEIAADQDQEDKHELCAMTSTVDVTFTLSAEVQAGTVALCGEFNNWSAQDTRLERGGDGSWQATVALEPGRSYRYRYLLDGQRWENAWQADRYVPNPYGSTDSVVVVGSAARQPSRALSKDLTWPAGRTLRDLVYPRASRSSEKARRLCDHDRHLQRSQQASGADLWLSSSAWSAGRARSYASCTGSRSYPSITRRWISTGR